MEDYYLSKLVISLIVAAFLAIIPASIASRKGRSFFGWWFFGWMLFIVALIVACAIPDKSWKLNVKENTVSINDRIKSADELLSLKKLLDENTITEADFMASKEKLMPIISQDRPPRMITNSSQSPYYDRGNTEILDIYKKLFNAGCITLNEFEKKKEEVLY